MYRGYLGADFSVDLSPELRAAYRKITGGVEASVFGGRAQQPPAQPTGWGAPTWLWPAAILGGAGLVALMILKR